MTTPLTRAPLARVPVLPLADPAMDRRLSPLDRLSVRVGLWLIVRGAARARPVDRTAADALRRAALERDRRERAWLRAALLRRPHI